VSELLESAGRRFARLATRAVVARPLVWRLFRGPLRRQFDWLAGVWEGRRGPEALLPLVAALERLPSAPTRVLDPGTGTGKAARLVAGLYPRAEVVGADLSPKMIEEAQRLVPAELTGRVRFEVADASALIHADGAFDLVLLLNMIPFFDELARVTEPGGWVVFASSWGAETPIYVPPERLRERLGAVGFEAFDEVSAGEGTALLARRSERG
jgi:SAM-dependent methyltransferase